MLAILPTVAGAQAVSPPRAIADAAADCWQAVGPTAIDEAALAAKGWKPGELKAKNGKPVETPLKFFGKQGSSVVLMVLAKSRACSVTARVGGVGDYKLLVSEVVQRLKSLEPGLKAGRGGTNGAAFRAGNRIALLEPTGTQSAPAARIIVGYSASETK
jgi:hypothetical protein